MAAPKAMLYRNDIGLFFDQSLLQYIKEGNNAKVLSVIQGENPCKLASSLGTTLLHFAAKYGNQWLTRHFIDLGIDVNVQNRLQETPLMYAIDGNHEKTVGLLLEANADIFLPDVGGECALAKALKDTTSKNVLKLLLDKVTAESLSNSEHVYNKSFHDNCPLYDFIPLNNVALTKILLEKGSAVNARKANTGGETALHQAVKQINYRQVQLLLDFNADANAERYDGETPLALCYEDRDSREMVKIVKSLLAMGAKMIDRQRQKIMVQYILSNGRSETVRVLFQHQLDLHYRDKCGSTPLHYLAMNPTPDILRELEGLDFDVNIRCTFRGYTMMHYAAAMRRSSSLHFLLEFGANTNVKDAFEQTPLYRLIEPLVVHQITSNKNNSLKCIDILLEGGADCQIFKEKFRFRSLAYYEPFSDETIEILSPVICQIALLEGKDCSIDQKMLTEIESCEQLKSIFDATKSQFAEFKRIYIDRSVTLFDFWTVKDEEISLFARNTKMASNLTSAVGKYNLDLHFNRRLRQRFLKFTRLVEMRKKITFVINKIFIEYCSVSVTNIADHIVSYLSDQDVCKILPILMSLHSINQTIR